VVAGTKGSQTAGLKNDGLAGGAWQLTSGRMPKV